MLRRAVTSNDEANQVLTEILTALQASVEPVMEMIRTTPLNLALVSVASKSFDLRQLVRVPSSVNLLGSVFDENTKTYREMTEREFCEMVLTPLVTNQKKAIRKVKTCSGSTDAIDNRLRNMISHLTRLQSRYQANLQVPVVFLVLVMAMLGIIPVHFLGSEQELAALFPANVPESSTFFYRINRLLEAHTFTTELKFFYGSVKAAIVAAQF